MPASRWTRDTAPMIHPTAIIHPDAVLAPDVRVGPYAVIEGAARIGAGCEIEAHAVITAYVVMGRENIIGHGAIIGGEPQDLAFKREVKSEVRIGDRNRIRELVTIHRGTAEGSATVVGDDCFLMAGAHLGHNVRLGSKVIIANNCLLAGQVDVDDNVFIGGGSVFHQRTHVGKYVIAQGMSGYSKDIPPFTIGAEINTIAGLNVIGMRRAGFSPDLRREIKEAFALVYLSGLNTTQALAAARERTWGPEAESFFAFIAAAKKRGICALIKNLGGSDGDSEG